MTETDIAKYIFTKWQDNNNIEDINILEEDRLLKKNIRLGIFYTLMHDSNKESINEVEALSISARKAKLMHKICLIYL